MSKKNETEVKSADAESLMSELNGLLKESIPFIIKFDVSKIIKSFSGDLTTLGEIKNKCLQKYGEKKEDTLDQYTIPLKSFDKYNKEMGELLEAVIIVRGKLKMADLKKIKSETQYFHIFKLVD